MVRMKAVEWFDWTGGISTSQVMTAVASDSRRQSGLLCVFHFCATL